MHGPWTPSPQISRAYFLLYLLIATSLPISAVADYSFCSGQPAWARFDQDCKGGCTICDSGGCTECTRECHTHHLCWVGAVAQCADTDAEDDPTAQHYEFMSTEYSVTCYGQSASGYVGQSYAGQEMVLAVHAGTGGGSGDNGTAPSGTCPASAPVPGARFSQVCEQPACAKACESTLSAIETEVNRLGPALEGFVDTFINAVKSRRRRLRRILFYFRKLLQNGDSDSDDLSGGEAYLGRGSRGSGGTIGQVGDTSTGGTGTGTADSSSDSSDLGVLSSEAWGDYSGSTISQSDVQDIDEAIGSVASPLKRIAELQGFQNLDLFPGEVQRDLSAGNIFTALGKNVVRQCNGLAGNFADVIADLKRAPNPISYVKAYTKYFSTVSCLWCCVGVAIDELKPLNCEEDCSRATVASTAWGYRASRYMDKCR